MARKAKQVYSWGSIDPKVIPDFEKKVYALQDAMIPRDVDGDSPVKVIIVNKHKQEMYGVPVPRNEVYSYDTHGYVEFHPDKQRALDNEHEKWLVYNLEAATRALESYFRERNYTFYTEKEAREKEAAEAKKPIQQRINEACEYCVEGKGFRTPESVLRKGHPIPDISWMHDLGEEINKLGGGFCKAYKLRRIQAGIPEKPEPEPRWCVKCQARLRDRNSRKGVEDKDICINSDCRYNNGKKTRKPSAKRRGQSKAKV